MSATFIKPYFSSKLTAQGFQEWPDGFGEDNIPSTLLDKAFHQKFISADSRSINQESYEMVVRHEIKVYINGFNSPATAIDEGLVSAEAIIADCLNLADYLAAGIKALFFDGYTIDPYDAIENDNIVVLTLTFSVRVYSCIS